MATKDKTGLGNVLPAHIQEAERYLKNAREILSEKAEKTDGYYSDRKYVRMAGNTAWNGVLEAMDGTLNVTAKMKKDQRPDIKDYQQAITVQDKKILSVFLSAYDTLHKAMGYDGNLNAKVVQSGLQDAKTIIEWCQIHSK